MKKRKMKKTKRSIKKRREQEVRITKEYYGKNKENQFWRTIPLLKLNYILETIKLTQKQNK
jgi:hypothetical protein